MKTNLLKNLFILTSLLIINACGDEKSSTPKPAKSVDMCPEAGCIPLSSSPNLQQGQTNQESPVDVDCLEKSDTEPCPAVDPTKVKINRDESVF